MTYAGENLRNELLRKIEHQLTRIANALEEKNTTAANSDVKCYGTSDNPMTKAEWKEHKASYKGMKNPFD